MRSVEFRKRDLFDSEAFQQIIKVRLFDENCDDSTIDRLVGSQAGDPVVASESARYVKRRSVPASCWM